MTRPAPSSQTAFQLYGFLDLGIGSQLEDRETEGSGSATLWGRVVCGSMPRKLPWKRGVASPARRKTDGSPAAPRFSAAPCAREPEIGSPSVQGDKARRSPSTSPPPRPQAECFMINGLDADDGYRMVEDEFFSVAGTFTAHLHKAEYHRLKNLAKNKNAVTIRAISRPVVGNKTEAVKRRQVVAELAARQKAGIKRARGENASDDDDTDGLDNPWTGTALQGLMARVRPKAVPLSSVVKSSTGTLAARRQDTGYSSPSVGGGARGMLSGPLAAHSHTGRAVSYAEAGGAGKSVDELRRTYDESDEDDLDAPSSFIPSQQNTLKCHAPVTGSDPRPVARSLAVTSGTSRQMMRNPGTAPRLRDDMAGTSGGFSTHLPRGVPAHQAPRSSAASLERGGPAHDGSGSSDGSDDDGIMQRIRERRKNRMAQARQDTQKEKDEKKSTERDRSPPPVNQQGQDVTLDIIPSFL